MWPWIHIHGLFRPWFGWKYPGLLMIVFKTTMHSLSRQACYWTHCHYSMGTRVCAKQSKANMAGIFKMPVPNTVRVHSWGCLVAVADPAVGSHKASESRNCHECWLFSLSVWRSDADDAPIALLGLQTSLITFGARYFDSWPLLFRDRTGWLPYSIRSVSLMEHRGHLGCAANCHLLIIA